MPSQPGSGCLLNVNAAPGLELEIDDGQEPLREQYGVGERAPHLLRRMMQIEFERNGFSS